MKAKVQSMMNATALLRRGNKGGTRPGHVWVEHAPFDIRCEGLNPLVGAGPARRFAQRHEDIVRGGRFLKKIWRTKEGDEFASRHCPACGREIEGEK